MKRTTIALFLSLLSLLSLIAHAGNPKIAALADKLSKTPGWMRGVFSSIRLPENAPIDSVLDQAVVRFHGGQVYLGKRVAPPYKVIAIEKILISPEEEPLTAALIDCDGQKIVLLRYEKEAGWWWNRKYDAD